MLLHHSTTTRDTSPATEPGKPANARRPKAQVAGRPGADGGTPRPGDAGEAEGARARKVGLPPNRVESRWPDDSGGNQFTFHAYGPYDGYRVYQGDEAAILVDVIAREQEFYAGQFREWTGPESPMRLFGCGAEVVPELVGDVVVKNELNIVAILRPRSDGDMTVLLFRAADPDLAPIRMSDVAPTRAPRPIEYRTKAEVEAGMGR